MDAFEDDGGVDMHEDMWDSVEVDSEFEDLLDEDVYADLDVDLETIDDKQNPEAFEHEPAHVESPSSPSRYARPHLYGLSQQPISDLHEPSHVHAPQGVRQTSNMDDYEDEDDEAEANYATQVERYTQYHQTHDLHEVASDSDIDETDDEEDEATLARPARTRRPKKAPSSSAITSSRNSRQNSLPNTTRARSRKSVKRESADDFDSELDDESYGPRTSKSTNRRAARASNTPAVNTAAHDLQELSLKLAREYATSVDAKKKELQEIERRIDQTRSLWDRLQNIWVNKVWNETLMAPRVQAAEAFRNAKRAGRPLKHERLATTKQIKQETEEMEAIMRKLDSGAASAAARAISSDATNASDVNSTNAGGPPPKKKKKLESVSRPLYCLTPNRGFVKVACQDCGRELFGNHLGFLNHCRMVHYVKFASWDDAVELCGTPVDESEVPADDPSRTESSSSMGFSISQQKSEAAKSYQMQRIAAPVARAGTAGANGYQGGITIDHTKPQGAQDAIKIATPNVHALPGASSAQPTASSASSAGGSGEGSRFYIKKQVIIGNSSKRLTKEDLASEDDAYRLLYWPTTMAAAARTSGPTPSTDATGTPLVPTHRWLLSIRSIGDDKLTNYISKVRFYLHPAFSPRNIVDVAHPPFQILRETNQEWPVRLQIFFKDPRNPPMSFTHYIVFQQGALEAVGEEYYADIEIDREYISGMVLDENVSMVSMIGSPSSRAHHSRELQASRYHQYLESNTSVKSDGAPNWAPGGPNAMDVSRGTAAPIDPHFMAGFATGHGGDGPAVPYDTLVEFVRHAASTMFPLISDDSSASPSMPYSVAKTAADWTAWSHGKRKSSEWQRALRISQLLVERFQVRRTTREILDLCKHLNLTPTPDDAVPHLNADGNEPLIPSDPHSPCVPPLTLYSRQYALPLLRSRHERLEMADHTQLIGYIRYCRFCGSVHSPIDRIDELEIACGEKKLLVLQESHSTFRELLERSIKQVKQANIEHQRVLSKSAQQHGHHHHASTSHASNHNSASSDNSLGAGGNSAQSSSSMSVDAKPHVETHNTPKATIAKRAPQTKQRASSLSASSGSVSAEANNRSTSNGAASSGSSNAISAAVAQANAIAPNIEKELNGKPTTPARRGRPAKLTKLVGSLLASPVAAATIVTTTPGTLEAPSNATVVYLNPPTTGAEMTENENSVPSSDAAAASAAAAVLPTPIISVDHKTGEIKWDMQVLVTMEPLAFVEFLKHLSTEQIAQLPNLPADRLNLLVEYLNSATAMSAEASSKGDSKSASPAPDGSAAPSADEASSTANKSESISTDANPSSSAAGLKDASSTMDVDSPSVPPADSTTPPPSSIEVVSSESSAWSSAQEAVLLGYYSKFPDALANGDPLPPDVLEALYLAGLPAESAVPAAAPVIIAPPVASTPSGTPGGRKKKKAPTAIAPSLFASASSDHPAGVSSAVNGELVMTVTPAKPLRDAHATGAAASAAFSPFGVQSSGIMVAPETAAETLSHPVFGSLDFKRAERPNAAELPGLHDQLDLLQLDHETSNHAEMMLLKLVTSFARRLLFGAAVVHAAEKSSEPTHETKYKVMVPLHAATAIVNNPINFDFLMDEGLARYTSLEMIQANALAEDPSAADIMEQLEPRLKLHRQMAASDASHAEAHAAALASDPSAQEASTTHVVETSQTKELQEPNKDQETQEKEKVQHNGNDPSTAANPSTAENQSLMQIDETTTQSNTAPEANSASSTNKMDQS